MPLFRHYQKVTPLRWLDENHFVGIVTRKRPGGTEHDEACYGWSKGAGFFIYTIGDGHIEKIGSVKRDEVGTR